MRKVLRVYTTYSSVTLAYVTDKDTQLSHRLPLFWYTSSYLKEPLDV